MRKLLIGLAVVLLAAIGVRAADNYAATVGAGKTFRCIEITGSICIPTFIIMDNTGQALGTAATPIAVTSTALTTIATNTTGVTQNSSSVGQTLAPIGVGSYAATTILPIGDPCQTTAKTTTPIGYTGNSLLISATASKKTYICHIAFVNASAETIALIEGTGTLCATGSVAIVGASPVANSMSFAANGGLSIGSGTASVAAASGTNTNVCFIKSGSGVSSGVVSYVQQ